MADLKKVKSGTPLVIPAQTFNAFIDAARDFQDRQRGITQSTHRDNREPDIVLVRNDGDEDVGRFGILGIDAPIVSPADNLDVFTGRVALACSIPDEDKHVGKFVVTLEPIRQSEVGRAFISGACPVELDVPEDEAYRSADIADGEHEHLKAGAGSGAEILWRESGAGTKWAIVRLGPLSSAVFIARIDGYNASDPTRHAWTQMSFDGSTFTPASLSSDGTDAKAGRDVNLAQQMPKDIHVIMWAGDNGHYWFVQPPSFRGTIISCSDASGEGQVEPVGVASPQPIDVYLGPWPWHRVGDVVQCVARPFGGGPSWQAAQLIQGSAKWEKPTGTPSILDGNGILADVQDAPDTVSCDE